MKRAEIEQLKQDALACFAKHGWALPPNPKWDVTDFGLGDWRRFGLVLINLAEEPEYCEKLMYAKRGMETPAHAHAKKKEDIICRAGELAVTLWPDRAAAEGSGGAASGVVRVDREPRTYRAGETIVLAAGSRVTLVPGVYHAFVPNSEECVIGEVSTANDDLNDNFFVRDDIGRFPTVED